MKDEFEKWIKKEIENIKISPPDEVWENISTQLDIDEVWNKIEKKLDWQKKIKSTVKTLLILLPLITSIAVVSYYLGIKKGQKQNLFAEKILDNSKNIQEKLINFKNFKSKKNPINKAKFVNNNYKNKIKKTINDKKSINNQNINKYANNTVNEIVNLIDSNINSIIEQDLKNLDNNIFSLEIKKNNNNDNPVSYQEKANYYSGIIFSPSLNWFLNNMTINSFNSYELNHSLLTPGFAVGALFGIKLNKDHLAPKNNFLQLELIAYENKGQTYNNYIEGKFVKERYFFKYASLQMVFSSKKTILPEILKKSSGFTAGISLSKLLAARYNLNNQDIDIKKNYKDYSLSLLIGYEYESYFKNYSFITGIRLKSSVSNIFKGTQYIPAYFNRTFPVSIMWSNQIRFHF